MTDDGISEVGGAWGGSQYPSGDDLMDNVFEPAFCSTKESIQRSNPPPPLSHCHDRPSSRQASTRNPNQLTVQRLWNKREREHSSIISHLHPTLLHQLAPTPPTSPGAEGLLTLHSLDGRHDSGYVPSPSSASSFTFSSDEDEPPPASNQNPRPGVTPPIAIPHTHRRPQHRAVSPPGTPPPQDLTPVWRGRTQSCPENVCSPPLPCAPVPRFTPLRTPAVTPAHGRTCSMPVTGPNGAPLLTPPLEVHTPAQRPTRDGVIDLAQEDGSGGNGHRRRVLVLALPDLVLDTEGRATGPCTPPSSHPPTYSSSNPRPHVRRPAWQRPRALSCDVTLEEEVGRELRRIADSFHLLSTHPENDDGEDSVWGRLRNSFRRHTCSSS